MSLVTVLAVSMWWLEFVFGVYVCQVIVLGQMKVCSVCWSFRVYLAQEAVFVFLIHREPDDAPSVGHGDTRAGAHPGPKIYEALYERGEEALCESRHWETVEEGWFSD